MSANIKIRLDLVRLTEYDEDGFLGIQCDPDGDGSVGVPAYEFAGPFGLYSRPLDPELGADGTSVALGSQLLTLVEGQEWTGIPLHDPRVVIQLPALQKGETIVHGSRYNFVRFHADGRISQMCTDDGTPNGKALIAEQAPDGWTWSAEWALLRNNALGLYYRHASGARIEAGSISGLPAPFGSLSSYAKLVAGLIEINGTAVQLGTGAFQPAAKATAALAVDGAIVTALQAVSAALAALGSVPQNGPASAAIATAATAIVAATSALAAGQVAVPALSVQVA